MKATKRPFIVSTVGWFGGAIFVVYAKDEVEARSKASKLGEVDDEVKIHDVHSLDKDKAVKVCTWAS